MKLTKRESRLLAVLMPAIPLFAYIAWLAAGTVRGAAPAKDTTAEIATVEEELEQARAELARLRTEDAGLDKRAAQLLSGWTDASMRPDTVRSIAARFREAGTEVVASGRAEADLPIATAASEALRAALREQGGGEPVPWRFDMECSFGALCAALRSLRDVDVFVLPLSLSVAPSATASRLRAVLWVWI